MLAKINLNSFKYWLDFLLAMTEKEIKARYKHAVLGFLWIILNPLLQMLVIGFVFQFFVPVKVDNYFLYLLAGLLPWNFFSMTVSKNTPMFFYERNLIKKAVFPREAIVLSIVLSNLFHLVISLGLLFCIALIFSLINLQLTNLLFLIVGLSWLTIITSALSLLLSTLHVKFRDINFMVQAGMPLWFYLTPIIYPLSLVPQHLTSWFYLNPIAPIIEIFRQAMIGQGYTRMINYTPALLMTGLLVAVSIFVFRKQSPNFDDWM